MIALLASLGVPERFRRVVAYALAALALLALLWAAKVAYDASVVDDYADRRQAGATKALDTAAEERAVDAVRNHFDAAEREEAIANAEEKEAAKPLAERATLPPTTLALNCSRFRLAYSKAELERMPSFKALCE